jgi:hypothetical protein
VHRLLSTNNEVTTLLYFPTLASLELLFRGTVDADKSVAIDYFHNFLSS